MKSRTYKVWLQKVGVILIAFHLSLFTSSAQNTFESSYNQIDEMGNVSQRNDNQNFNKHNTDTTRNKEIPKGIYTWTLDRKFGDRILVEPDTLPHLFMNTTFNSGMYGEYNHTGSNYTSRLSRIFFNRPETDIFIFTQPYGFVDKQPDKFLFMNTLSPFTNVLYDNCGDKTNGEDHIDAKFSVNAGKQINVGFDLDYAYARGYFSDQGISHFNSILFGSYLGDRYNLHVFFNASHQKATENGGITTDTYITHPESFQDQYNENEIPTVLTTNWNRNDHQHLFLTHRYNIGFYRKVKMTEAELKARQFAQESKRQKEAKGGDHPLEDPSKGNPGKGKEIKPAGRPAGAKIMGAQPKPDSLSIAVDTTRIQVDGQAAIDSLNRAQAIQDSIDATMKKEYVPVTSIIHTMEWNNNRHNYLAYHTLDNYYKNQYYTRNEGLGNDSISDTARNMQFKNTFGLALLEGFNKYVKAGLKAFVTYDYNRYEMPDTISGVVSQNRWNEHDISIGGQLSKTQGKTLHFNLFAETWVAGANAGKLHVDFSTDVNFKLFGDTVRLAANAYFHRDNPGFFMTKYHGKHVWWDNDNLSAETRTRIEGVFSYEKTNTKLRVGIEEIQNYTYFGMSYDYHADSRANLTAGVFQESGNINILTAQLHQNFRLGPLNWENVITYQNSSNNTTLPLPTWNFFSNLYLKFKIAKVLGVELGADATYFTKYYAPDFCPMINQFAVQMNNDSKVELGGYPFVDVYANMVLKGVRFFVMMSHINSGSGNRMSFLTPHYPTNSNVLHLGVSWNFFN